MGRNNAAEIVATCERYWVETRVPSPVITELRQELVERLDTAAGAGKPPRTVTGRDVILFAESMASRHRIPPPPHPSQSPAERARQRWLDFIPAYGWVLPLVALAVLVMIFGPKEDAVDNPDFWRWLWLGIAVVLGVGEMLTAGFFMLPFAIGAAIAALLAWADVGLAVQLIAFIATSLIALFALRRFAWSDKEPSYPVGAKRFTNAQALVVEPIDVLSETGRVRHGGEIWRAVNDSTDVIESGVLVRVVEVRGTHLVVERMPDQKPGSG